MSNEQLLARRLADWWLRGAGNVGDGNGPAEVADVVDAADDAAKKRELFETNPDKELSFRRLFNTQSSVVFTIRNLTEAHVAFKIKTTAPKEFLVRPNTGVLSPGQLLEIVGRCPLCIRNGWCAARPHAALATSVWPFSDKPLDVAGGMYHVWLTACVLSRVSARCPAAKPCLLEITVLLYARTGVALSRSEKFLIQALQLDETQHHASLNVVRSVQACLLNESF